MWIVQCLEINFNLSSKQGEIGQVWRLEGANYETPNTAAYRNDSCNESQKISYWVSSDYVWFQASAAKLMKTAPF
jgi:hypothetical protein